MSYHSVYVEIRKRWEAVIAPFNPVLPVEYPNESFTKPSPSVMWGRFHVYHGKEVQMDIGDTVKTFRNPGMLTIQLFVGLDSGTIDILKKADTIADGFRNYNGTEVSFQEPHVENIGNDGFGWYQVNITTIFKVDTQH